MIRRTLLVYATLIVVWAVVISWQVAEHRRVSEAARALLISRARDITSTLGLVVRSQRRWGGIVSRERMESAITALIRPDEVNSIALLSSSGEVVASAGEPIEFKPTGTFRPGEHWTEQSVTLMNLVDLGTNVTQEADGNPPPPPPPPIVMPRQEIFMTFETNRPPSSRPPRERPAQRPPGPGAEGTELVQGDAATNAAISTNIVSSPRGPRPPGGPRSFVRPNWMATEEFQSLIAKQGVHSFLIVMSTQSMLKTNEQDLWVRTIIAALAGLAALGSGLAWRNLVMSSELQIRLVRASEQNTHLKEMSLAAAGLAHETRNPLNIIRGLTQMISKEAGISAETRQKSRAILEEADRVTAQLNEFINYSRPREVRRTAVALGALVGEVARALTYDLEEKHVRLRVFEDQLTIEADEQLLRQALFNLLLNATQAVEPGGEIEVAVQRHSGVASLEVRDNGPGVPPENRLEIFKPYFTTQPKGMGLGLAVVQQIVAAHGWDIACTANEPRGAVFRIDHLKLVPKA